MANPNFNSLNDCIDWFLSRYPYTTNALVDGDFLVYFDGRNLTNPLGLINNWDQKYQVISDRNTTLSSLLTKVESMHVARKVPIKMEIDGVAFYNFDSIIMQFIREMAGYFNSKGVPAHYGTADSFRDGVSSYTSLTLGGKISSAGHGTLVVTAHWDLGPIFGQQDMTLTEAVNKVFDSQRELFEQFFQQYKQPKQLVGGQ